MLRELYEAICADAVAAKALVTVRPDGEPSHRYVLLDRSTGKIEWREAEPMPRAHVAGNLDTIVSFAERFTEAVVVWYGRKGVTLLLDDNTRRDQVKLPLTYSPQLAALLKLETDVQRKSFSQAELILFLRTTLAGCFEPSLLEVLRRIKFRVSDAGEGVVGHGKSSVGRQIEAELTGHQAIPEYVVFTLPIFAAGFRAVGQVQCAIEVQANTQMFQLIPLANATESAVAEAEVQLGLMLMDLLKAHEVPVLYGSP